MLTPGKLRILRADEPDPYPDAIHVDVDMEQEENVIISGKKIKPSKKLQEAIAALKH